MVTQGSFTRMFNPMAADIICGTGMFAAADDPLHHCWYYLWHPLLILSVASACRQRERSLRHTVVDGDGAWHGSGSCTEEWCVAPEKGPRVERFNPMDCRRRPYPTRHYCRLINMDAILSSSQKCRRILTLGVHLYVLFLRESFCLEYIYMSL